MRYDDFLNEAELKAYVRTLHARAKQYKLRAGWGVAELRGVILESGGVCAWCGVSLLHQPFEVDHIIPLSERGAHTLDNLAVACPNCNRRKASLHPARFAQEMAVQLGKTTPLIERVLAHFGISATFQKPLL